MGSVNYGGPSGSPLSSEGAQSLLAEWLTARAVYDKAWQAYVDACDDHRGEGIEHPDPQPESGAADAAVEALNAVEARIQALPVIGPDSAFLRLFILAVTAVDGSDINPSIGAFCREWGIAKGVRRDALAYLSEGERS